MIICRWYQHWTEPALVISLRGFQQWLLGRHFYGWTLSPTDRITTHQFTGNGSPQEGTGGAPCIHWWITNLLLQAYHTVSKHLCDISHNSWTSKSHPCHFLCWVGISMCVRQCSFSQITSHSAIPGKPGAFTDFQGTLLTGWSRQAVSLVDTERKAKEENVSKSFQL